jgi:hypothetical protein
MTHVVAFQPGSSIPTEVQRLVHQWVVIEAGSEVRLPLLLRPEDVCGGVVVRTAGEQQGLSVGRRGRVQGVFQFQGHA